MNSVPSALAFLRSLRQAIGEYLTHYHDERNHRNGEPVVPASRASCVVRRTRAAVSAIRWNPKLLFRGRDIGFRLSIWIVRLLIFRPF